MESLTVATYNVHMWGDADFEDNFDRVLKIVKHQNPDLLCLQEATGEETKEFAKQSSYEYYVSRGGCAIMSKTPFKEHE
jgi:endonuclease/exonuclease/phosphatase family metal-dependent hydrolase